VKFNIRKWKLNVLFCASAAILLAGVTYAAANKTRQVAAGDKAKVTGSILSRDGDLVRVRDKKSGEVAVVNITDNTKIERKTKWDGGKLVSEIGGLGPGKTTQTFAVDPDSHQLRIIVQMEGGRSGQARSITNIYDADAR